MDQTKDCTRELIAKAHNNDKEAREKLVTRSEERRVGKECRL